MNDRYTINPLSLKQLRNTPLKKRQNSFPTLAIPVILAGSGVIRNKAARKLTEFAEKLKLPVINTMMAKGAIPFDNPYSLWTVGIPMEDYQTKVLENASLVICIGYDIIEYAPNKWHLNNADIIHIDSLPADINKTYQPKWK